MAITDTKASGTGAAEPTAKAPRAAAAGPAYGRTAIVVSGHTMALAVVRALGEEGVPVVVGHYDERDVAQRSRYAKGELRLPDPEDDEGAFVRALLAEADRYAGSVLIPASDESLVALSRHKTVLAEGYIVACPDWPATRDIIDKARTYAIAEAHGVAAPRTIVPAAAAELEDAAEQIGFPLLVKPKESHLFYSHFKRKMVRVTGMEDLREAYLAAVEAGLGVMLQEIIPGSDNTVVNYNAYVCGGQCVAEFTARQIRKAPPEFGSPRVVRSERIPEVIEPGRQILEAIGMSGFACVEFKEDARDGRYVLMEVNGRHNLSGLLAVRCGLNFPLIEYRYQVERELPEDPDFQPGIYWTDMFRDVGYSLRYATFERYSPGYYLAPYVRRHHDAIVDRRDLRPFWARLSYLGRNASRTARAAGTTSRTALKPAKGAS
jgi:D-aspartate ligase